MHLRCEFLNFTLKFYLNTVQNINNSEHYKTKFRNWNSIQYLHVFKKRLTSNKVSSNLLNFVSIYCLLQRSVTGKKSFSKSIVLQHDRGNIHGLARNRIRSVGIMAKSRSFVCNDRFFVTYILYSTTKNSEVFLNLKQC